MLTALAAGVPSVPLPWPMRASCPQIFHEHWFSLSKVTEPNPKLPMNTHAPVSILPPSPPLLQVSHPSVMVQNKKKACFTQFSAPNMVVGKTLHKEKSYLSFESTDQIPNPKSLPLNYTNKDIPFDLTGGGTQGDRPSKPSQWKELTFATNFSKQWIWRKCFPNTNTEWSETQPLMQPESCM